jgi:hypothetical protein
VPWTGVKCGIMAVAELRTTISVMHIDEDVAGIEENDELLCKVSDERAAPCR